MLKVFCHLPSLTSGRVILIESPALVTCKPSEGIGCGECRIEVEKDEVELSILLAEELDVVLWPIVATKV